MDGQTPAKPRPVPAPRRAMPHPHPQPGTHGADGDETRGISPLNAPLLITQPSFTSQRHGRWQSWRGHFHGGRGGAEPVPRSRRGGLWQEPGEGAALDSSSEFASEALAPWEGKAGHGLGIVALSPRARRARAPHGAFLLITVLLLLHSPPGGARHGPAGAAPLSWAPEWP